MDDGDCYCQTGKEGAIPPLPEGSGLLAEIYMTSGNTSEKAAAAGGKCKDCGFEYREYDGHIIPCPRCRAEIAVEAIKKSDSALTIFRALQAPHDGIEKDGIEAAEIISETLKKLGL